MEGGFILEEHQSSNGLFPASIGSCNGCMNTYWIRDNFYISMALDEECSELVTDAFKTIIDNYHEKIEYHGRVKPDCKYMHIHPRYDEDLHEFPEPWLWVQNDSVGNLLEKIAESGDKERSVLLVKYLNCIEYWDCPDYGFWEEYEFDRDRNYLGERLHSSSLGSCVRALDKYREHFFSSDMIDELIRKGNGVMNALLPGETKTRHADLAQLSLLYPKQMVDDDMKKQILRNVSMLETMNGIKRYLGDIWDGKDYKLGFGKEMSWTIGLLWKYLITGEDYLFLRAQHIRNITGTLPEGMVNGRPNCNNPLLWSEAFYKLAYEKFHGKKPFLPTESNILL